VIATLHAPTRENVNGPIPFDLDGNRTFDLGGVNG